MLTWYAFYSNGCFNVIPNVTDAAKNKIRISVAVGIKTKFYVSNYE